VDCGSPDPDELTCADDVDNDCDGRIDCADPDCALDPACVPFCGDGLCQLSVGEDPCTCEIDCGPPLPLEGPEPECTDGADNDCDGLVDCADPDCAIYPICGGPCGDGICDPGVPENPCNCEVDCGPPHPIEPLGLCADGIDNDCDGFIDCDDPDCTADPACGAVCGNGVIEGAEECDDGNTNDGDGCSSTCTLEDADSDGIPDLSDNCPAVANPLQEDADVDGHGDACDACPNDPENDVDNDGVCGDVDECPSVSASLESVLTYTGDLLLPIDGTGAAMAVLSAQLLAADDESPIVGVPMTCHVTGSTDPPVLETCFGVTDESGEAGCFLELVPDVYSVTVISDYLGCPVSFDEAFLVVFDPNVPRATGGGFILPDADSTRPAESSRDKANFGFVVRIDRNQSAAGNLEFQYKAADINLKSFDMTWYTVSNNKAMFQGEGTVNGEGLFTFRVDAKDGDLAGSQPDQFDIRIWNGTDTEAAPYHRAKNDLAGGSIVIHRR
jgi:cysteine-rich repeat protein